MSRPGIVWFRRDLRLRDLPTLLSVADTSDRALALFVLDESLLRPSGSPRRTFLMRCLRALDEDLGGRLLVTHGDPVTVVPALARELDADAVHISSDHGPYGTRRDEAVERALGDVPLVRTGSPYAVAPGRVRKPDDTPYKVFTPFQRAWHEHGWRAPAATDAGTVDWIDPGNLDARVPIPATTTSTGSRCQPPGKPPRCTAGTSSATTTCRTTTPSGTDRTSTAPAGSPPT